MWRRSALYTFVGMLAAVAVPQHAQAQTQVTVQLTSPTAASPGAGAVINPGRYYYSPYSGTVTGFNNGQAINLNCVDFFHDVYVGETWVANITNLATGTAMNYTRVNNIDMYQQAAWLTQQIGSNPATLADETKAIQTAIWNIFYSAADDFNGSTARETESYWLTQSALHYHELDYSGMYVLTPTNANGQYYPDASQQEFIIGDATFSQQSVAPEPASLTLMATGFAGLLGAVHRRRRKAAAAVQSDTESL